MQRFTMPGKKVGVNKRCQTAQSCTLRASAKSHSQKQIGLFLPGKNNIEKKLEAKNVVHISLSFVQV